MRTAEISELKAKLSAHIQYVKNGEEVLILDGKTPVAMLVAPQPADQDEEYGERERRLIAAGVMVPAKERWSPGRQWPLPPGPVISQEVIDQVWREEREDR